MNIKKPLLILTPVLMISGLACAQETAPVKPIERDFVKVTNFTYGPWRSSVIGGGGYIQNVVPAPSNPQRFYTYVDVAGCSRSDDGGKTWKMLHGNLPPGGNNEVRGMLVDPRDDRKILVATGSMWTKKEGIYRSEDAGETFTKVLDAQFFGNGPARSSGFILTRSSQNPDFIAAASYKDGVFLSRDNGKTWAQSGATNLYPLDLRFDRSNDKRLWLSASGSKIHNKSFPAGFFRSDDGGVTWNKLEGAAPQEIVQDPKNAGILYGIFRSEIIRKSTDGGTTWEDFSDGLQIKRLEPGKWKESIDKTAYNALGVGPDFILTCNTRDADFYKLQSGGTKWEKVERNAPEVGDWFHKGGWAFGGAAGSITVDPHDPKHWFMTDFFAIYQSFDSGKNWRLTVDGMETTVAHTTLQDPTDAGVMHVGVADVGGFYSTDGGTRFRKASVPDDKEVNDADAGGGNMKSMDLNPKLPNRLYGVANRNWHVQWQANQVFISIDRGQTWTRSPMIGLPDTGKQPCTTITADANDPYTVYLTVAGQVKPNSGGVYKSTDGGARWTWMSEGLPNDSWYFPSDIWAHGRQLASSADGSLISISKQQSLVHRFDPKTQKWEKVNFQRGGTLWSVTADRLKPGRYFIGTRDDALYRTDDGGVTWKKVYNKGISFVATDAAVAGRVAGSNVNGIVLSTDGGETWKELDRKLPNREDAIPGFAGERLFAATGGSGVFWMPLSTAGEKSVTAKPLVKAEAPVKSGLPALQNMNFDAEGETPPGWTVEATTGEVELSRDTKEVQKDSVASLRISTGGELASGTVYQEWTPALWNFKVNGGIRAKGDFKKIVAQIQPFDAVGQPLKPVVLREQQANNGWWDGIGKTVVLPANTARTRLEINIEGKGQIWLDNFRVSLPQPLYPQ
jgi:photosystem II stability/assembly factor-like uncharacterized protein